jgi:hypothetical protein
MGASNLINDYGMIISCEFIGTSIWFHLGKVSVALDNFPCEKEIEAN